MPKAFPLEFRRDVVAVARKSDVSIKQVAADFGISESCLTRWLKIADRDESSSSDNRGLQAELRSVKKRLKLLEQENEVLRRAAAYFARDINPK